MAYALLAVYDGVFLHLYKFRLYDQKESRFEHLTHTVRALLFVGILLTVFINIENNNLFLLGLTLVLLDIITLLIDAYVEKDSRVFMGGLPRWEYIIHLLVNGFHFASITSLLIIKIKFTDLGISLNNNLHVFKNFEFFKLVAVNLLPGAIIISILHILVYNIKFKKYINTLKINCC
ncbi:hypothetical protein L950_0216895 [Sphingobacterium sp. IITKGP-BTPF85]|nr:hypothetical protein L950_0216895 [Sphingobacterium sp. IITKGP-BTPF85]